MFISLYLGLCLCFSNITRDEFTSKLHGLTRDKGQRAYSSFVLCILSLGGVGYVTTVDNKEVYIDEIYDRLDSNNFPAMAGKPKFLYIDTNGRDLAKDHGLVLPKPGPNSHKIDKTNQLEHIQIVQSSTVSSVQDSKPRVELSTPVIDEFCTRVACKADFVVYLASFPQYLAMHHNGMGTISTRVLAETFYKHAHEYHVIDLAMKIRRKLSSKVLLQNRQVLTTLDTLNKDFYMFPVLPSS